MILRLNKEVWWLQVRFWVFKIDRALFLISKSYFLPNPKFFSITSKLLRPHQTFSRYLGEFFALLNISLTFWLWCDFLISPSPLFLFSRSLFTQLRSRYSTIFYQFCFRSSSLLNQNQNRDNTFLKSRRLFISFDNLFLSLLPRYFSNFAYHSYQKSHSRKIPSKNLKHPTPTPL